MKKLLLLFSYLLINFNSFSQITIAQWNFDAYTAVPQRHIQLIGHQIVYHLYLLEI